jgi:hypothetical protein
MDFMRFGSSGKTPGSKRQRNARHQTSNSESATVEVHGRVEFGAAWAFGYWGLEF